MHRGKLIGFLVVILAMGLGSRAALAANDSRISLKMDFGVSSYPSDRRFSTGFFPSVNGDPAHCDVQAMMSYNFDIKFGRSGYGALCYKVRKDVELELGFGYTSIQMEIKQSEGGISQGTECWCAEWCALQFDTVKDSGFSYFTVRPGATLLLSSKSGIVPYLSIGFDLMRVKAEASLDLGIPYIEADTSGHLPVYLIRLSELEELQLEGSEIVTGLDIGSGLEFKASSMLSITFGFSYLIQFQKPFKDFGKLVKTASGLTAEGSGYSEGMNIKNIGAAIGMRWQF